MSPSHANNHGRRYRYYVSGHGVENDATAKSGWRLPAPELESVVIDAITNFLEDKLHLSRTLEPGANGIEAMLSRASQLARQFRDTPRPEQRRSIMSWVERIEVQRDRVNIELRLNTLKKALLDDVVESNATMRRANGKATTTIELPVAFKRRGVETKIVLTEVSQTRNGPDTNLIEAITLGHKWFAEVKGGDMGSISEIARRYKFNQGDASRVMRLGLLAPDIVEAILDGRQPVELTAASLKRIGELPNSWRAQRKALGFV